MGQWFLDSGLRQDFGILDMNGIRAAHRAVGTPPPCCLGGPPALIPPETDEQEDLAPERPNVCRECNDSFENRIDERPIFIINSHGNGDTVRDRGSQRGTLWSYPSILHAPTVINISNQSPCCLNTCEQFFLWKGMQNWALKQAPGTPEVRPQRTKRPRGAQGQPNPDTQKQMLLILSRLALKHDLEIRELQTATFRTLLVKQDEPLMLASKGATGLFVEKSKEGQRPPGEPHVHEWAAMTTDPALSAEDKQKVVTYTFSANSPETLLQSIYWNQFKKHFRRTGSSGSVQWFPDSAHLVPHHQSHEIEGSQREVRPSSSGRQRSRTSTYARRSVMQAGGKGGQQLLTSWIRPKMPSIVQSGTRETGGQRLLTSWMRPKSSSAPTVSSAPVSAMEYDSSAPEVCAATVPVVENISPAPAASFSETVPVIESISPAPVGYTSPAALMEHVCPAPAVSIADPAMYSAQDTVVEYISPTTATSFAAPTPVQYATPVKHAAPEQYDAPMMTVIGVDLNRDGISDVLQQPQMGRRLSNSDTGPAWRTSELRKSDQNTWTVTRVDTILLAYGEVVRTLPFFVRCTLQCPSRVRRVPSPSCVEFVS